MNRGRVDRGVKARPRGLALPLVCGCRVRAAIGSGDDGSGVAHRPAVLSFYEVHRGFDPNDDTAPIYGTMPRLRNIEADRGRWDIVSWAVDPGIVLIFHPVMLHGVTPVYQGAAAARCRWASSATTRSTPHYRGPRESATATIPIGPGRRSRTCSASGRRAIRSGIRGFPRFARALR